MATRDEPSETDRLLAEVDSMLTGKREPARSVQPHGEVHRSGPLVARLRTAALYGVGAGAGVWVLFALLPFLRAGSGAVGAFLATFVAVALFRRAD